MSRNKSKAKKKRLGKAYKKAKSAPRWASLKRFGLDRAKKKTLKPRRTRNWRKSDLDE